MAHGPRTPGRPATAPGRQTRDLYSTLTPPRLPSPMSIRRLDHYLVIAADLEKTRAFYTDVLGLRVGPRPPFDFPGYWLYAGETAVVHLADASREGQGSDTGGTGALDHVAFAASGLATMLASLGKHGIVPRQRTVPGQGLHQLFVRDPDGVTIELNFPASEHVEHAQGGPPG